jgi:hypothetical protein
MLSSQSTNIEINEMNNLPFITMIELPFMTENNEKALSMLGGEKAIKSTIINDGTLHTSLQEGYSIPIHSTTQKSQGILIRLKRRKNDTEQVPDVEVIGLVKKSYVFNNPATYNVM